MAKSGLEIPIKVRLGGSINVSDLSMGPSYFDRGLKRKVMENEHVIENPDSIICPVDGIYFNHGS